MIEVQKQWLKEDGKWVHKDIVVQPATSDLPALPARPRAPPPPKPQPVSKPALPKRNGAVQSQGAPVPVRPTPALPPRRPSDQPSINSRQQLDMVLSRRTSSESTSSAATTETSLSVYSNGTSKSDRFAIRAPEYDPSKLPTLPPKRTKEEKEAAAQAARFPNRRTSQTATRQPQAQSKSPPPLPGRTQSIDQQAVSNVQKRIMPALTHSESLPNGVSAGARKLPTRQLQEQVLPNIPAEVVSAVDEQPPALPRRNMPPPPAKRSALSLGFNGSHEVTPQLPTRPDSVPRNGTPPPVPLHSRPNLEELQASKPNINNTPQHPTTNAVITPRQPRTAENCLHCRDFSGPDNHAAKFPRQSVPNGDLDWLAHQLCDPFPSHTDKARAIFTWGHHNIAYNIRDFVDNNVKRSTPASTLATGLAVCEGYADIFATLALKAGMEAIKIGGASKGAGYSPMAPGASIPAFKSTHAWNAVKIDGGEWKLVDPCWGAGNVCITKVQYNKHFTPSWFTMSNSHFGLSHYPEDTSKMFREDGQILPWDQYNILSRDVTGAQVYGKYTDEEGINSKSFKPVINPINTTEAPSVRFTFQRICRHYDPKRIGPGLPYVYVLHMEGLDGTDRNHVAFKQGDGIWWLDVPVKDLGKSGQKVNVYTVITIDGRDGRGLTVEDYERKHGRCGMSFGGVASWTIA